MAAIYGQKGKQATMKQKQVWPVYGHSGYFRREVLAHFFTWADAADFAMQPMLRNGWEQRNLYVGTVK